MVKIHSAFSILFRKILNLFSVLWELRETTKLNLNISDKFRDFSLSFIDDLAIFSHHSKIFSPRLSLPKQNIFYIFFRNLFVILCPIDSEEETCGKLNIKIHGHFFDKSCVGKLCGIWIVQSSIDFGATWLIVKFGFWLVEWLSIFGTI